MAQTRNEGTLLEYSKIFDKEHLDKMSRLLWLTQKLSEIQHLCLLEIQNDLNAQGKYKYEIKHNHEQIKKLVDKNRRMIFDKMSCEALDMYVDEFSKLAEAIFRAAGIENLDEKVYSRVK